MRKKDLIAEVEYQKRRANDYMEEASHWAGEYSKIHGEYGAVIKKLNALKLKVAQGE